MQNSKQGLGNRRAAQPISNHMLKAGIVGLPNVGKSTLFNALAKTRKAEAANYPFCTIDPNVAVISVPDDRLKPLAAIAKTQTIIPANIQFVDIAGLVQGAAQGEGLGNKFLSHIRQVDAVIQVVRCFDDPDIHHVAGSINPIRDIETITTELILADLESIQNSIARRAKDVKRSDKTAIIETAVLHKLANHLNNDKPAITLNLTPEEQKIARPFFLLSQKPTIFAANIKENALATASKNPYIQQVRQHAKKQHNCQTTTISAQIESDLLDLNPIEALDFLAELGVQESGANALIRNAYQLLGLQTFFTAGEKEVRAWTIRQGNTAPQAAGVIHTDFERGFIKAETVAYQDLIQCGSIATARERGLYRMEGKEYIVQDGDVMLFKFNV